MNPLTVGSLINIKRRDGRIQEAIVSCIDQELNCAKVEWLENGESKGKDVHFANIMSLNPNIQIPKTSTATREKFTTSKKVDDNFLNSSKRKFSAYSKDSRVHSAKPRLIYNSIINSRQASEVSVDSKLINNKTTRSAIEYNGKVKESATVKKLSKLEKDRIERRKKHAEVKAEKEAIVKKNQHNPHWELGNMIIEYRNKIEFKPLSSKDNNIEDHLITVAVRKRPLNGSDLTKKEIDIVTIPNKNQLIIHEPKFKVDLTRYLDNHVFTFDYAFNENCSNFMVYKYTAQPLVKTVFEGGFATCFAYGQTGSGKTYTMSGNLTDANQKGIYALTAADIFRDINSTKYRNLGLSVSCSFFEIYVKKISDLLNNKRTLKILEDGKQQVQVVGLTEHSVSSVQEVLQLIKIGNEVRASGQTSANANSSRSHAIFQIYLRRNSNLKKIYGKFSLIDLAGNERGADTFSSSKLTRLEGSEINQSLLSLKECIRALGRKGAHLPFRASKLTQVLRDSFVGINSKTCMIAMVSPDVSSCENTLNTLRYADRVKELGGDTITPKPTVTIDYNSNSTSLNNMDTLHVPVQHSTPSIVNQTKMKNEVHNLQKEFVEKVQEIVKSSNSNLDNYTHTFNNVIDDVITFLNEAKI
ncbi:kinesin-like protein Klp10A [Diabrotica virgifera virgifera]|uniref:Kinesin-like protein n=1 Tax=Diabrotica virgifera virgifera TaxID=50390 RepID=A0ABM5KYS9_DIAVI|nr:kinesin-like protein Klp10A [Diabrotica virgifera virgifera]